MREIKFRAWDGLNMFEIFNSQTQKDWFLPNWKENIKVIQFTGMKDCEGKDIYEGDILQFDIIKDHLYKVNYKNGCFWLNRINSLEQFPLYDANLDRQKIIGNIYENSDLIS